MKKVEKTCPICSIKFSVPFCHQNRYITCGWKCGGIFRRKPRILNTCEHCKIEFVSKKTPTKPQRFCSQNCSAQIKKTKVQRVCVECNKSFEIAPNRLLRSNTHGKFCGRTCLLKKWNRDSIKAQKAGCYRKNAWRTYGKYCHDCGNKDERVLVIHHIDGNRKNGKLSNLIPVCHNCHCIRHCEMGDGRVFSGAR